MDGKGTLCGPSYGGGGEGTSEGNVGHAFSWTKECQMRSLGILSGESDVSGTAMNIFGERLWEPRSLPITEVLGHSSGVNGGERGVLISGNHPHQIGRLSVRPEESTR